MLNGVDIEDGSQIRPWAFVYIAVLLAVAGFAIAATVAYLRRRMSIASKLLIPAIVMGIFPAIVPGILAGVARILILRQHSDTR